MEFSETLQSTPVEATEVMAQSAVDNIKKVWSHGNASVEQLTEALLSVAKISFTGEESQLRTLIDHGVTPVLLDILRKHRDIDDLCYEVSNILLDLVSNTSSYVDYFITLGLLDDVIWLLRCPDPDANYNAFALLVSHQVCG